jgi:O-antigen/teichoic acid export membrane protein
MIHIAGHFKQTQKSAVAESVINAVTSIVLVQFFGIAGVLLGTAISSLYRTNYLIIYVNKKILGRKSANSYLCWFVNFAVFLLITYVSRWIPVTLDSYARIFLFCIPYALGAVAVHFVCISLFQPRAFRFVLEGVRRILIK